MIRGTIAIARQVVTRQPRLFALVLAGTLAITATLLWPIDDDMGTQWWFNAAHVPAFFLASLLWIFLFDRAGVSFWLTSAAALLVGSGLALGTELAQYVVPNRWPTRGDLILDVVGVLAAVLVYAAWTWRTRERDA